MKYFFFFAFLMAFWTLSSAQVHRKPLFEEYTSTICTFSDLSDSVVMAFERAHGGGICMLKWHTKFGNHTGTIPFYRAFPSGINRGSFYRAPGVPFMFGNGELRHNPYLSDKTVEYFDSVYKQLFDMTSPYAIQVSQTRFGDSLECVVSIKLVGEPIADTSLKIGIVISEKSINFREETDYQFASTVHTNVVRATIPPFSNSGGLNSGAPILGLPYLSLGETRTMTYHIKIDTAWNPAQIQTTAFIQSMDTKEVFQSESSLLQSTVFSTKKNADEITIAPNPATEIATIFYALNRSGNITFSLFDVKGTRLFHEFEGQQAAGEHQMNFNVSGYPNGVYYFRIQMGDKIETKTIVISH